MTRIQSWSTTLCALLALVLSAPVQAQAISSAAMESKLQNLYDTWKDRDGGWILLPDLRVIDSAEEYDETSVGLHLTEGVTYKVVAKCDAYCGDLALVLSDSRGAVVGTGSAGDLEQPIDFVSPASGDYSLNISMDACDDYFCDYGIDVYKARMASAVTTHAPAPLKPMPALPGVAEAATQAARSGNEDLARKNLQARYDYWKDRDSGWTLLPALRTIGTTVAGGTQTVKYTLSAGVTYKIMGACDDNCTNLDLKVADAAGKTLASDVDKDDIPILDLMPTTGGLVTVTATMTACKQRNCAYGVDVYQAGKAAVLQPAAPQSAAPAAPQLAAPVVAAPASSSEAQARSNLDFRFTYWSDSYTIFPNSRAISQLKTSEKVNVTLTEFQAGVAFKVMGACDDDCSGLTLELRDPGGKLIDSDTSTLGIPSVHLTPTGAGDYMLTVKMNACARPAGCFFGVEIYQPK